MVSAALTGTIGSSKSAFGAKAEARPGRPKGSRTAPLRGTPNGQDYEISFLSTEFPWSGLFKAFRRVKMLAFVGQAAFCIVAIVTAAATGYMVELTVDAFQSGSPHGWKPGGVHGAPEPLLGAAGLSFSLLMALTDLSAVV